MFKVLWNKSYICCGCGERFSEENAYKTYRKVCICNECNNKLARVESEGCFPGIKKLEFVIAPFYYKEPYRDIFLKFKFNGDYAVGRILGMLMTEYFEASEELSEFDYITVVPLSKARMNERGYNQSQLLAEMIAKKLGIEIRNVLKRIKNKKPQSKLSGYKRMTNIKGVFEVTEDVKDKKILVFDDICTTGNTMEECAAVLKDRGALSVGGIACAYVFHDCSKNYEAYSVL